MSEPGFWDNQEDAQQVVSEVKRLRAVLEPYDRISSRLEDFETMMDLAAEEGAEKEGLKEAQPIAEKIRKEIAQLEVQTFLSGKMDRNDAIFTVYAGAGGTESCDWANMLLRMYLYWFERRGFKSEVSEIQPGDETGIKSATVLVYGDFAFGYLKSERGVHRLVRISPFDANNRRHTSFAAVNVLAQIDDSVEIEIPDSDLRIDTFRASGAGGQHVNTTDSAVRITHLPTGIVVACQNERSQHKNRATAMKILRSRLYEREQAKLEAEREVAYKDQDEIGWGNQIRSYVLHPYQMVKDLRTGVQTSNVQSVLDGNLDDFVNAYVQGEQR